MGRQFEDDEERNGNGDGAFDERKHCKPKAQMEPRRVDITMKLHPFISPHYPRISHYLGGFRSADELNVLVLTFIQCFFFFFFFFF